MKQVARNLTDMWDGFLLGKRYLIHDRDPLFTEAVRGLLRGRYSPCPTRGLETNRAVGEATRRSRRVARRGV